MLFSPVDQTNLYQTKVAIKTCLLFGTLRYIFDIVLKGLNACRAGLLKATGDIYTCKILVIAGIIFTNLQK